MFELLATENQEASIQNVPDKSQHKATKRAPVHFIEAHNLNSKLTYQYIFGAWEKIHANTERTDKFHADVALGWM